MTEISGGRWDNLLSRLFPIKGRPIAPSMSPELQPIVVVQPDAPELGLLRRERLYSLGVEIAAAATIPKLVLRNPPGSSGLIIVEQIWASSNTNQTRFQVRTQPLPAPPVDLATVATGTTRDTRQAGTAATSAVPGFGVISTEATVGALAGGLIVDAAINAFLLTPLLTVPIILGPNTAVALQTVNVNITADYNIHWRERSAEPSELTA